MRSKYAEFAVIKLHRYLKGRGEGGVGWAKNVVR